MGVDDEELIREYDGQHGALQAIRAADVFEPATPIKIRERRRPNWSLAMILVLAVVAGYGIYHVVGSSPTHSANNTAASDIDHSVGSHHRAHPATASPSPTPSVTAPQNVVISLTAIQDCWVEFTKPDGRFLTQAYIIGGSSKTWTFDRSVTMDIGNPGGIVLTVNGKKLGSPGSAGQPVTLSLGPGKPVTG